MSDKRTKASLIALQLGYGKDIAKMLEDIEKNSNLSEDEKDRRYTRILLNKRIDMCK